MYEPLTHLPNPSAAADHLDARLADADTQRALGGFTVLLLDIEHAGAAAAQAGKGLLDMVAWRATKLLRDSDYIASFGGDRFLVVVPQISERETIDVVTNKLIDGLTLPYAVGADEARVTINIGASFFARHGQDRETLLDCADIALAASRRTGKNCACVFEENLRG